MGDNPSGQALTQAQRNRRSIAKLGKVSKLFTFDAPTAQLLEQLAQAQGCSATQVVRQALRAYAQALGVNADA